MSLSEREFIGRLTVWLEHQINASVVSFLQYFMYVHSEKFQLFVNSILYVYNKLLEFVRMIN